MPKRFEIDITFTHEAEARLRAAGFVPAVRWLDLRNDPRTDKALKTVEALTLLDRREETAKKGAQ